MLKGNNVVGDTMRAPKLETGRRALGETRGDRWRRRGRVLCVWCALLYTWAQQRGGIERSGWKGFSAARISSREGIRRGKKGQQVDGNTMPDFGGEERAS